ncbi:MAG: hypothetical protein WCC53_09415 [Thermoanaerobaculia bacterium]
MATGRAMQLTKQVGEYLVAAELCRRGLIATTFTGNVPHYDIIASNATGRHQAIQVKTINGGGWQFDVRAFAEISLDGKRQVVGARVPAPYPDLVCVFVRLRERGEDEFYILTWKDLQRMMIKGHRGYLARHGGVRPKKYDSYHGAIRPERLAKHRNKWSVLETRLRGVRSRN